MIRKIHRNNSNLIAAMRFVMSFDGTISICRYSLLFILSFDKKSFVIYQMIIW